jgi:D-alanyl-D-alanine carboxypeptidase
VTAAIQSSAPANRTEAAWEDDSIVSAIVDEVESQAARLNLPGGALALVRGTESILHAFGQASLSYGVAATPDTLFHTASVGKHLTAVTLLRLLYRRGLSVDEPIGRFLSDIPETWHDRSIGSILRHTSGIPDYGQGDFDLTEPHSRAEILAAANRPLLFDSARAWAYSNTNYMLAGYLVEALSGQDFGGALQTEVLQTAGLEATRLDNAEAVIPGRAEPYIFRNASFVHAPRMDGAYSGYPDGPLLTSARDAAAWLRAMMGRRLLPPPVDLVFGEPADIGDGLVAPYGCGVFLDSLRGNRLLSHTGGLPGFTAFFAWLPDLELGIALLTNVSLMDSRVQRYIGHRCLEIAVPGTTALSLPPAMDDHPDWTAEMAAIFVRGENSLPRERLSPGLRRVMDAGAGEQLFANRAHCPPLLECSLVESRPLGAAQMRRYRLRHEDLVEHVSVGYAPDGRIFWVFPD